MTIKDLIEKLKEYPEDMEVLAYHSGYSADNKFKYIAVNPFIKEERFVEVGDGFYMLIAARPCEETSGAKKCLVI